MRKLQKSSTLALAGISCLIVSFSNFTGLGKQVKNPSLSPIEKLKKEWLFSKPINCKDDENSYKYFILDGDVYRYAGGDLSDLRIVDEKGDAAPYYIEQGMTEYKSREVRYASKKIGENVNRKEKRSTFDFQVIPAQKTFAGRRLFLQMPRGDISRQVIVYGRHGDTDWNEIKRESIYRLEKYEKTDIEFDSELDYPFYRIEIIDAAPGDTIPGLEVAGNTSTRYEQLYQKNSLEYTVKNNETTTLVTILNPNRLKIFRMYFTIDGIFKRAFDIYIKTETDIKDRHRPKMEKQNEHILYGSLYNFAFKDSTVSSKVIDLSRDPLASEKIYLSIENNNDKPLDIRGVDASYYVDRVVFKSIKGSAYRLFFGNRHAVRPVYDIETYKALVEKESKDACSCGKIEGTIPGDQGKPFFSEKKLKIMLNVVILLVSLLLIFFIVKKLS